MPIIRSRRDFLANASLAVVAGAVGARTSLAEEGPPETTTIRLGRFPGICGAPVYAAEELLRAEGFTDVGYVPKPPLDAVARGDTDFDFDAAPWVVSQLAAGEPITALAGIHSGCFELFAREPIRTISDLKGKRFGIPAFGSSPTCSLQSWRRTSGSIPRRTSTG
jgi:NitT/TauT family transport system substrate-binding protein